MAEICCPAGEAATSKDSLCPRAARRRRMELRRMRLHVAPPPQSMILVAPPHHSPNKNKRRRLDPSTSGSASQLIKADSRKNSASSISTAEMTLNHRWFPRYGVTSICGRRREMEDAVSIHPGFAVPPPNPPRLQQKQLESFHFFGVFDGHGCSHVSQLCKKRMHAIMAEELEQRLQAAQQNETQMERAWWREAMEKCFARMDKEAVASSSHSKTISSHSTASCSCELRLPRCDHVGSTAIVAILGPRHLVIANCGDSRAVLCRNGSAVPLSSDHKPDRPDELHRIQAAGGRVIYWDGARVFGVLAMSRAIGDSYLKPFVISEPEVMVTETTEGDEFLILATDGLWDVVSNEMACQLVSRCLQAVCCSSSKEEEQDSDGEDQDKAAGGRDEACADAAMLLTKLALARHSTDNISVVVINLKR